MPGFWTLGPAIVFPVTAQNAIGTESSCIHAGGYDAGYPSYYLTDVQEYDGTSWSLGDDILNPTAAGGGFGTSTAGAVTGGVESYIFGDYTPKTQEYDGTSWSLGGNLIEEMSSFGVAPSGTLSAGLVFGGWRLEGSSDDADVKDETREYNGSSWSTGGLLPKILRICGGIGTQTDCFCCGGSKYESPSGPYDDVYLYNGSSWSSHSILPVITNVYSGCGLTSSGLACSSSTNGFYGTYEYDGASWLTNGNFCWAGRYGGRVSGSTTGAVFAGGGDDDYPLNADGHSYVMECEIWNSSTIPIIPFGPSTYLNSGTDYGARFWIPPIVEANDLLIAFCMDTDDDTFSAPTGWTLGDSGTNDRNASFAWFWRRVASSSEGGTNVMFNSLDDAGALVCCGGIVIRGALTSGTPVEQAVSWGTTQGTTATIPSTSTLGDDRLIVALLGIEDDETATNPTNYKRVFSRYTTTGGGGNLLVFVREFLNQGSIPADSCTISNKEYLGTFVFAVIPEPVIEDFIEAEAGSYSITGSIDTSFKAKLVVLGGSYEYIPTVPATLPCAIGSYVLWGKEVSEEINANAASYTLIGQDASLDRRRIPIKGKSMIVDVATNWGDTSNTSIWSIDLFLRGEKLVFDNSNMEGDCPESGGQGEIENAFDMKTIVGSKILDHSFYTYNNLVSMFRFYVNFLDGEIEFDEMIITNMFGAGFSYFDNRGIKDIKIYMSDDYQDSYVYEAAIPNSRLIFDGQIPKNPSDTVAYPYRVPLGNYIIGNPGSYGFNGTSVALERGIGIDDWEDTWLSGWANRTIIKVDSIKLPDNVEGTPIRLIIGDQGGIPSNYQDMTHIFDEIGSSFLKIAVTDYTGLQQLKVEVAYWDVTERFGVLYASRETQTFYEWKDTYVYLYFDSTHADNTSYVGAITTAVAQSVWDSAYKGVWSLLQDPTGDNNSILDSTSNEIHGTPEMFEAEDRIFLYRNVTAYAFDDYDTVIKLSCPKSYFNFISNSGFFTIEAFAQAADDNYETIIGNCHGYVGSGFCIRLIDTGIYSQNTFSWAAYKGVGKPSVAELHAGGGAVNDTDPHYLGVKSTDWTNRGVRFFVDEVNRGHNWELNDAELEGVLGTEDASFDTYIGAAGYSASPFYTAVFDGHISQIRISDVPRSDAWMVATSYDFRDEWVVFGITEAYSEKGRFSYGGTYVLSGHETMEKTKELGSGNFSLSGTEVAFAAKIDLPSLPLTAKSVILDVISNYGNLNSVGLRHLEFYLEGNLVDVYFIDKNSSYDDITGYGFYDQYTHPEWIFGTGETPGINSLRLDGSYSNVSWRTNDAYQITGGARVTCVFDSPITFDEIKYYNYHSYGSFTDMGVKTIKVNISSSAITVDTDTSGVLLDAEFEVWQEVQRRDFDISIPNSLLLFWGDLERHSDVDEADGHNLALPGTVLASSGSLSVTGSDMFFRFGFVMSVDSDSYSISGSEVGFISSSAGIGIYTYTGYDTAKRIYPASSGIYEIIGEGLAQSYSMEVDSGEYVLEGTSTNHADPGVYFLYEWFTHSTSLGEGMSGAEGSYSLSFQEVPRLYWFSGSYSLEGPQQLGGINLKNKLEGSPVFFLTLTGAENETTDLEIPIASINSSLRSGKPTYLRVSVPDISQAPNIISRKDGTLQVEMAYKLLSGEVTQRELIIEANLADIRIKRDAERGNAVSVDLVGHKQKTFVKKAITLYECNLKTRKNGQVEKCVFPDPNVYIRPGDRITVGEDTFDCNMIGLTIGEKTSKMEIFAA